MIVNTATDSTLELFKGLLKETKTTLTKRDPLMVVIYTRVSSHKQIMGASFEIQYEACMEYARKNGYTVMQIFGGKHESAKNDDRAEFNKLKTFLNTNKVVSKVLVFSLDRFSRTGGAAISLDESYAKKGINIVSVTQQFDQSALGKLFKNYTYLNSRADNDTRTTNISNGVKNWLSKGYWVGPVPFGYTNLKRREKCFNHEYIINKDGELLRRAFQWRLTGMYTNVEIAKMLRKLGMKTNHERLHKIFQNPFYAGIIMSKALPGEIIEGKHPAIVSKEDFLKINGIFKAKAETRLPYGREDAELSLKKFMTCDITGQPYTGFLQKQRNLYYYKTRSARNSKCRSAEIVNKIFANHLKQYQLEAKYMPLLEKAIEIEYAEANKDNVLQYGVIQKQLAESKKKLETLEQKLLFEGLERELYDKYARPLKVEISQLEVEISGFEQIHSSNIKNVVEKSVKLCQNLSKLWVSSNIKNKVFIQKLLFPEGIRYNCENDTVQTNRVNSIFQLIADLAIYTEGGEPKEEDFNSEKCPTVNLQTLKFLSRPSKFLLLLYKVYIV